mmetsp:Transcript_4344/g.9875  ORF Transcript_4344/g.9875 Transcript_4344/m.9875 type:complete len:236 (-) Transcript_4344:1533-2240(-)
MLLLSSPRTPWRLYTNAAPPKPITAITAASCERTVVCGVDRPAAPHRRIDERIAARCSAAGTKKTIAKPERPHTAKTRAVSRIYAVQKSGGSAHNAAATRRDRSLTGRSPSRLAASTWLKSGKAAVVVIRGSNITHRAMHLAHSGVAVPAGAPPRKSSKFSVINGRVAAPNAAAAEQPSVRYSTVQVLMAAIKAARESCGLAALRTREGTCGCAMKAKRKVEKDGPKRELLKISR